MSSIVQRLQLIWTSNSAQARGDIGVTSGSVLQLGRNVQQSGRQAGIASQQMRAFGTTLRYMVAGSVIYGIGSMVRNLSQLQTQMGLISAIGTTAGFKELSRTGGGIQNLTVQMLNASTQLVTPMDEVSTAMTNLVSSVQATQGIGTKDLVPALEIIGKAAKLSQTPIQDMTKGITAMNQAFGRPQSMMNIKHLAAQWYEMIALVPGGQAAAPQLVGQLGAIAGGARMAHVTPGQAFAMTASTLRFGIPPAQAGMGLAYLLRSIAQPETAGTVKSAKALFSSLGITNESVQKEGGLNTLFKIFAAADKRGISGNFRKAAKTAYANRDDPNYDPNSVAGLGLSGEGINILGGIFRRQHALRTAIAIYSMWKTGTFDSDLKRLGDSQSAYQKSLGDFADAWKNFTAQVPLSQAATALQNLQTEMVMGFGPFLKFPAQAITGVSRFAGKHPDETRYAAQAAAGMVIALGGGAIASKIPGLRNIPGLGKFGKLFGGITGGAGKALVTTQAVQDTMRGLEDPMAPRGSTPTKPIYVYVVGQAPWADSGGGGSGDDPLTKVFNEGKKDLPWITTFGLLMKKRLGAILTKILGRSAAGAILSDVVGTVGVRKALGTVASHALTRGAFKAVPVVGTALTAWDYFSDPGGSVHSYVDVNPAGLMSAGKMRKFPLVAALARKYQNAPYGHGRMQPWISALSDPKGSGFGSYGNLEKALESMNVINRPILQALNNQKITGDIWLKIDLTDTKGKVTHARVHLPPETFVGGNRPGSRGRTKPMKIVGAMKNV